jgi:hypothetical protein
MDDIIDGMMMTLAPASCFLLPCWGFPQASAVMHQSRNLLLRLLLQALLLLPRALS